MESNDSLNPAYVAIASYRQPCCLGGYTSTPSGVIVCTGHNWQIFNVMVFVMSDGDRSPALSTALLVSCFRTCSCFLLLASCRPCLHRHCLRCFDFSRPPHVVASNTNRQSRTVCFRKTKNTLSAYPGYCCRTVLTPQLNVRRFV